MILPGTILIRHSDVSAPDGWMVSCAAQERGMPSHAPIVGSASVGHAEIRTLA
jgi:hypothetical protein